MIDLLCIPYAGAMTSCYHNLKKYLPKEICMTTVELPGRGSRRKETRCVRFTDTVEDIFEHYRDIFQRGNYGVFGHSMGSTMAYELAHMIEERGLPLPKHLFFSGRMAPQQTELYPNLSEKTPEEFQTEMIQLGGIPSELIEQPKLLKYFMQKIYDDNKVLEDYQYKEGQEPFSCDISVMYGKDEPISCYMKKEVWQELTNQECHLYQFSGDHFFINPHAEEIASLIGQELMNK